MQKTCKHASSGKTLNLFWAGKKSGRQKRRYNVPSYPFRFGIVTLFIQVGELTLQGTRKKQERIKVDRDVQSKINHPSLMKTAENLETILQKRKQIKANCCSHRLRVLGMPFSLVSQHFLIPQTGKNNVSRSLIYLLLFLLKKTDNIFWVAEV